MAENSHTISNEQRTFAAGQASASALEHQHQAMLEQNNVPFGIPTGVPNSTPNPDSLLQPQQLPGYHNLVDMASARALAASTVEIESRPRNSREPWAGVCNGIKVNISGLPYVMTSARCDASIDQRKVFDHKGPADVLPKSRYDFAVSQPLTLGGTAVTQTPIAGVTGESQFPSQLNSLLRVESTPAFDAIPAIEETHLAAATPVLGQQVAAIGFPQANNQRLTVTTGTYLGRLSGEDFVGYRNGFDTKGAVCGAGGIGSSAVLSNGHTLGPLEAELWIDPRTAQMLNYDHPQILASRLAQYDSSLGVNVGAFSTLCIYDTTSYESDSWLAAAWEAEGGK